MKSFRLLIRSLWTAAWAIALYLLWSDRRSSSVAPLLLLAAPLLSLLTIFGLNLHKIISHPQFGGHKVNVVVDDVFGGRRDWFLFGLVTFVTDMTVGSYMIYAGDGLAGAGEVFIALRLVAYVLGWIDTTTIGRRLGRWLGIPLSERDQ